jgi:large subunit ribosomal protein L35
LHRRQGSVIDHDAFVADRSVSLIAVRRRCRSEIPGMTKLKTKRAAAKRFSFTATGKIKRGHANHRHNFTGQPKSAKLRHRKQGYVHPSDAVLVRLMLPHG